MGLLVTAGGQPGLAVADTVLERARAGQISLIRFLYADHGGIIRGKATHVSGLEARMASGIGHTVAMMAMNMLDHLQPVEGMGPVGEVRIKPDPRTFVPLPYAPGAAAMASDLVRPDGQPWEACARTFLKQAIAELAAEGYALEAAFEPEFTLGQRVPDPAGGPDRLVPATTACATPRPVSSAPTTSPWTWSRRWRRSWWWSSTHTPSWATPAGSGHPAHAGAALGRQPPALPGDRPGRGVPARGVGQPGAEAHNGPVRERHPPARVAVRARGRTGRRGGRTSSPMPATGTGCPRPAIASSAACSHTCPR